MQREVQKLGKNLCNKFQKHLIQYYIEENMQMSCLKKKPQEYWSMECICEHESQAP